jgi:hypothetical protein
VASKITLIGSKISANPAHASPSSTIPSYAKPNTIAFQSHTGVRLMLVLKDGKKTSVTLKIVNTVMMRNALTKITNFGPTFVRHKSASKSGTRTSANLMSAYTAPLTAAFKTISDGMTTSATQASVSLFSMTSIAKTNLIARRSHIGVSLMLVSDDGVKTSANLIAAEIAPTESAPSSITFGGNKPNPSISA